jgi:PhnB protein
MSISLDPYIFFPGNCREAMEFYKGVFGGELSLQTYGEVNAANDANPADNIMHAALESGIKLYGSDTSEASAAAKKVSLCLGGESDQEDKLRQIFEGLSEGGDVRSPLKTEFWGDTFGTLTDKFGVDWMVNIAAAKKA